VKRARGFLLGLSPSAWWRADAVTLDGDGRVARIRDLSGNGKDLSQADASRRPSWRES